MQRLSSLTGKIVKCIIVDDKTSLESKISLRKANLAYDEIITSRSKTLAMLRLSVIKPEQVLPGSGAQAEAT